MKVFENINFRRWFPHIGAILLFILLAYAYLPGLLEGKRLFQSDGMAWKALYEESRAYKEKTGEEALWTNAIFGGMPTTTITLPSENNYISHIYNFLNTGIHPASDLLIAMLGTYLLLLVLGVNPWLAVAGAVAFSFASYNVQIIAAGHNTKVAAIAFMPWVVAAFLYAFHKRMFLGTALFGIALSMELYANHPQITYYLAILLFFAGIAELLLAWKGKRLNKFFKVVCLLFVAGILGLGTNVNRLLPTWEYAKHTMRGGSEIGGKNKSDGLDISYATAWSYGIGESVNMLIPDFRGGASVGDLGEDSETCRALQRNGVAQPRQVVKNMPMYWGEQQFTSGPMYMGAIVVFLFFFALFYFTGVVRWTTVAVSLLVLFLSWGEHFMAFTEFFFNHVPLYNKFRVPSMILVLFQLVMPVLGMAALDRLLKKDISGKFLSGRSGKAFLKAFICTGGISLIFVLLPSIAGSFSGAVDKNMPQWLLPALVQDRMALLRADALRSAIFIILAASVIYAGIAGKMKKIYIMPLIFILVTLDIWNVDRRYLSNDRLRNRRPGSEFVMTNADKVILKDKDLSYRVMDLTTSDFPKLSNAMISGMISNAFNSSTEAYFHKLTGGYSAAKMQRYQDIIDRYLTKEIVNIGYGLNIGKSITPEILNGVVSQGKIMNMMNTRYFIFNPNVVARNEHAMGNVWFVKDIRIVTTPDQEIDALSDMNITDEAAMDKSFAAALQGTAYGRDSSDFILLDKYSPDNLTYRYKASGERLAVFSEVYYPGWKISIDGGEKKDVLRANYILRAACLPAGEHVVNLIFEPASYRQGGLIASICSLFLIIVTLVQFFVKKDSKAEEEI